MIMGPPVFVIDAEGFIKVIGSDMPPFKTEMTEGPPRRYLFVLKDEVIEEEVTVLNTEAL